MTIIKKKKGERNLLQGMRLQQNKIQTKK